jgi:hypothetical protein
MILPILATQVGRIIGMSHWYPARNKLHLYIMEETDLKNITINLKTKVENST